MDWCLQPVKSTKNKRKTNSLLAFIYGGFIIAKIGIIHRKNSYVYVKSLTLIAYLHKMNPRKLSDYYAASIQHTRKLMHYNLWENTKHKFIEIKTYFDAKHSSMRLIAKLRAICTKQPHETTLIARQFDADCNAIAVQRWRRCAFYSPGLAPAYPGLCM